MTVAASCLGCGWTAGPSADWDAVDRAADRHTKAKPGHPTATLAVPATARDHGDHGDHGEVHDARLSRPLPRRQRPAVQ